MSESLSVSLTARQREILLRGLRFVRSSRMLDFRDTTDITEDKRSDDLQMVRELMSLLDQRSPAQAAV